MERLLFKHTNFWKDKTILQHIILSLFLLAISLIVTYFARLYANDHSTSYIVPDILLDNLPVVNVAIFFFQGALTFVFILLGILMYEPKFIPFTLEGTALFFFVRAIFMVMTHLAPPSVEYYNYIHHEHHTKEILFTLTTGNDMFFSGHAGYPFLLAIIFWKIKTLRYFFMFVSALGSVIVILGHLHYSIDVFSSFFIAFGVFWMARKFFKREYELTISKNEIHI